jgi:polyphosphate kinase
MLDSVQSLPTGVAAAARNAGFSSLDDATDGGLLLGRETSLLQFNERVLALAQDRRVPLLERLTFLTICSTNLDEFFEVRAAGLRHRVALGVDADRSSEPPPARILATTARIAHELVARQYRLLNSEILPELSREGLYVLFSADWEPAMRSWAEEYFRREVLPVLTPVGLDPSHPFPMIVNKSLNFLVTLSGSDSFGRKGRIAVVQAPRLLSRLIRLPDEVAGGRAVFVTLSSVIRNFVGSLFPGMSVTGCHPFRLTRDSNLWLNEEEIDDLLRALHGELPRRNYGSAVRLEVSTTCPPDASAFLLRQFSLGEADLYRVDGPVNMHRLSALYAMVDRPDLKYPRFTPGVPDSLRHASDPFAAIRAGDVLLDHPFQPFDVVIDLLRRAAADPDVVALKVTLYRTGKDSPLTDALADAARNGKEVTAVIELRARFDEAQNIDTAIRLQRVGAKVVYGVGGFKTHVKMMLLVRREPDGMRSYVHLGTGNYHIENTHSYTDFGLLTCDPDLAADTHELFRQLTGLGHAQPLRKIVQAPFALHDRILGLIEAETENARRGKPARIRAKVNALIEPRVIRALYRASQAGVDVDLVVRGVCCLRPGVPGVSERIRVRSVLGRFLEHHRVYHFHAGGADVVYLSSADWMQRNFFRRIEIAFPIENPALRARVLSEGLDAYLHADAECWELTADGTYRSHPEGRRGIRTQDELLARLASHGV